MVSDNYIENKCSKCGECCGDILPLTNEDITRIQNYIKENNVMIKNQKKTIQRMCPFLEKTKENKCKIYNIRPEICKLYSCRTTYKWQVAVMKQMVGAINSVPVEKFVTKEVLEFHKKNPRHLDMWEVIRGNV